MSNMLRGSLTSTTDAKGVLGFKGERGYSNYELYVKNGGTMTEQEWLDHFGVDLTGYCKTSEMTSYVNTTAGDLEELETTDKTDLVSAINELNTNINSLDDRDNYSTTEKVIGTWINSKPIYRKVINFGALPGNAQKSVDYGVLNVDWVINAYGFARRITDSSPAYTWLPIQCNRPKTPADGIGFWFEDSTIQIMTGNAGRTAFTETYVIMEYTKTTD